MEASTPWTRLATRVLRVALARKDLTYARLAVALVDLGYTETERSLILKVTRGTAKLELLLQVIDISSARPPAVWSAAMRSQGDWGQRAAAVLSAELARQPWVTSDELIQRLRRFGNNISERALMAHISDGSLSLAVALQCLTALGSTSLDQYIDADDLVDAALASASEIRSP
ncbi:DUF6471 domain-containing protein [Paraburkholderia humisilvae]|uniref:DUF6471 domain-containing protein n=1 Tax=Paraburkholderia humisilvae TaxID=627669 RepID=A0A6J5DE55_9BURK|nr:DUF6471 domain-containing protein [Paraburkholderia humisilvae]CAB3752458.1 hypothetical protein LMG29542_01759 [Paraburkholderia humisilvae]